MAHRSSNLCADTNVAVGASVSWEGTKSVNDWLALQPTDQWKEFFTKNGYLVVQNLVDGDDLSKYRVLYNQLLDGKIDASNHRHDLGNLEEQHVKDKENICQIMWPSVYVENLNEGPIHQRAAAVAKMILGNDMAFDFDMLISKAPHTNTITPWHQDQSYWLDMPDKRSASCWCAMDDADVDNGCMWFIAGSHNKPMREHQPAAPGVHVLMCDASEDEGTPAPLKAGSCTFHHGNTIHYTRGNTTERNRRAFITNFRPQAMVDYERENKYDHGKEGVDKVKGKLGQTHEKQMKNS